MTKRLRKSISLVLCFMMVLSMYMPVFAATSSKAYDAHWAKNTIESAVESGALNGYPDGSLKMDKKVTRAEFFALVNKSFKYETMVKIEYNDVLSDSWYAPTIAMSEAAGYIAGYPDGGIHPNRNITRQEAAAILSRIKKLPASAEGASFMDAHEIGAWSRSAVDSVFEAKIMNGYPEGNFKPRSFINRAETVVAISNSVNYKSTVEPETASKDIVYSKAGTYGPLEDKDTIEGNVTISETGVVLQNTIIKGNLTITEDVGNGDVTLNNVTVNGIVNINGGGENSIHFINVTTGKVYVLKDGGPVRIVASGTSIIESLMAGSDVKLEEVDMTGTGFEGIIVEKEAKGGINIRLAGVKCEKVDIQAASVTLNTDKATSIAIFTADAKTTVKGEGIISRAIINANEVIFQTPPNTITKAPGLISSNSTAYSSDAGSGSSSSSSKKSVKVEPKVEVIDATEVKPAEKNGDTEVNIPNASLREAVAVALGKKENEIITKSDMLLLTELDGDIINFNSQKHRGVDNLTGLEYATNLEWVDLSENIISDLSPLSNATKIKWLEVDRNNISDLSPLSKMTQLEHLNIYNNAGIINLTPIAHLVSIKWIDMHHCSRGNNPLNVEELANLINLEYLSFETSIIEDLSFVKSLSKLTTLSCNNTFVTDLEPVQDLAIAAYDDWSGERFFNMYGQILKAPVQICSDANGMEYRFKSPVKNNERYKAHVESVAAQSGEIIQAPGLDDSSVDSDYVTIEFDHGTDEVVVKIAKNETSEKRQYTAKILLDYGMYALKINFDITQDAMVSGTIDSILEDEDKVVKDKVVKDEVVEDETVEVDKIEIVSVPEEPSIEIIT